MLVPLEMLWLEAIRLLRWNGPVTRAWNSAPTTGTMTTTEGTALRKTKGAGGSISTTPNKNPHLCLTMTLTNKMLCSTLIFRRCHSANLNGVYYPNGHYSASTDDGVVWYPWKGWWYSLKTSAMKLRPVDHKTRLADDQVAVSLKPPF